MFSYIHGIMAVVVLSKRAKKAQKEYEDLGWKIIDVTAHSDSATFVKFSPMFAHGSIPVPSLEGVADSESVEGVWQALKVFENEGIDFRKLKVLNMKAVKRPATEKRGAILGHAWFGGECGGTTTIDYLEARKKIYIPTYRWVLENRLQNELALLRGLLAEGHRIALLDYETNANVEDVERPLSHASLIKAALLS